MDVSAQIIGALTRLCRENDVPAAVLLTFDQGFTRMGVATMGNGLMAAASADRLGGQLGTAFRAGDFAAALKGGA